MVLASLIVPMVQNVISLFNHGTLQGSSYQSRSMVCTCTPLTSLRHPR